MQETMYNPPQSGTAGLRGVLQVYATASNPASKVARSIMNLSPESV